MIVLKVTTYLIVSIIVKNIQDTSTTYDESWKVYWIMNDQVVGHTCVQDPTICKRTYPEEGNNEGR
jgi:hypothetical protein